MTMIFRLHWGTPIHTNQDGLREFTTVGEAKIIFFTIFKFLLSFGYSFQSNFPMIVIFCCPQRWWVGSGCDGAPREGWRKQVMPLPSITTISIVIIIITTNIITMITWSSPPPPPRWPCASALPWSGSPSPSWCWGSSSATTLPRWSGLAAGRKLVLLEKWPRPKYSDKTFQRIELCPTGWPPALLLCYILAGAQVSSICFITGHIT